MTKDDLQAAAIAAGIPDLFATILSDTYASVAKGALYDTSGTLSRLIGQPTTLFQTIVTGFVRQLAAGGQPESHA